jgi:acyl-CoA thioester hydrolase
VPADVVHELPMRWADLDSLNHVNNVVYLDYAAESRALLVEDGLLDAESTVAEVAVDFLRPLLLSTRPVHVVCTHDGDGLVQEIRSAGSDTVFARVTTAFGPPPALAVQGASVAPLPVRVRRSDLDLTGSVSPTKMFELFQESRILFLSHRLSTMSPGRFVVGRVEVVLARPMSWRTEPYGTRAWVSRVGTSSFTIESQLVDDDGVLAQCRAVLVGFDLESQRSRTLTPLEKDELGSISLPG